MRRPTGFLLLVLTGLMLSGCSTLPYNPLPDTNVYYCENGATEVNVFGRNLTCANVEKYLYMGGEVTACYRGTPDPLCKPIA